MNDRKIINALVSNRMTSVELAVLLLLNEDALYVMELADKAGLPQSTTSYTLTTLAARGLVERRESSAPFREHALGRARSVQAFITPEGRRIVRSVFPHVLTPQLETPHEKV